MIHAIIGNLLGLFIANYIYEVFVGSKEEIKELIRNPYFDKSFGYWLRFCWLACGAASVWLGLYMTGRAW